MEYLIAYIVIGIICTVWDLYSVQTNLKNGYEVDGAEYKWMPFLIGLIWPITIIYEIYSRYKNRGEWGSGDE